MGKCCIEFKIVSKLTINLEVYDRESVEKVEDDIKTIVNDFEPQIDDMISGVRKPILVTQHGHVIKLVSAREVRLTDAGEQAVISEGYK